MGRMITLFGTILEPTDNTPAGTFVLDVDSGLGDAAEFHLAGQISFNRRQCREIHEAKSRGERDIIRIPEHIARFKSELAGNVRKKGKR
jgi:hypothetical protein